MPAFARLEAAAGALVDLAADLGWLLNMRAEVVPTATCPLSIKG